MSTLVRLALAGAWRRGVGDRYRSLLVTVCVALLVTATGGVLGAAHAHERAVERLEKRGYGSADDGAPADYLRDVSYDAAPNRDQITVITWHVVDDAPLPRGFPADARSGVFYLSPALARLTRSSAVLRDRFGDAGALDPAWVAQADELVAFRLSDDPSGLTERLVDRPGAGPGDVTLPKRDATLAPTALMLVGPGLGLLWAAASVPAPRLGRRLELLHRLGAARRSVRAVALVHAASLVVPGALAGTIGWDLLARRLDRIPFTDLAVNPGDLRLPAVEAALLALGVVVLYSGLVAAASMRPRQARRASHHLALFVLVGVALMVAAHLQSERRTSMQVFLVGLGALVVGVPGLVERLYRLVGRRMVGRGTWQLVVAGRQLERSATGTARSQAAWAGLVLLLPVGATWVATNRVPDPLPSRAFRVVEVRGEVYGEAVSARHSWLEGTVGAASARVAIERLDPTDQRAPQMVLVADCDTFRELFEVDCAPDGSVALPPGLFGSFAPRSSPSIPDGFDLDPGRLVFVDTDGQLEAALRKVAVVSPGLSVVSALDQGRRDSPLVRFVLGVITSMAIVTVLALTLAIAGHAARTARPRRRLAVVGASRRAVATVAALEASLSVGLAAAATVPLTLLALWVMRSVEPATVVPAGSMAGIGLAMLAATTLAGCAAALATRVQERPRD